MLRDEDYLGPIVSEDSKILVTVSHENDSLPVAWAFEHLRASKGRSFGTRVVHFEDNVNLVSFQRMLLNGIIWASLMNVPENGKTCGQD